MANIESDENSKKTRKVGTSPVAAQEAQGGQSTAPGGQSAASGGQSATTGGQSAAAAQRAPQPRREKPQSPASGGNGATRSATRHPNPDEIRRRAYQIFEQRGRQHGRDYDDWLEAERELKSKAS